MVEYEVRERVGLLTIRRPEARNAVNPEVAEKMEAAIDRFEADPEVWVGILTGEGPVFSAGADLKAIASGQAAAINTERGGFGGFVRRQREKPVIAAVDGPALAGGCELVLACDMVVASTNATFGLPEVKRSLVAAAGGLFRLPRKVPPNIAMELALTGDPMPAERAYQLGLVNELVDPGKALDAAMGMADRICANAPLAVRASRKIVLASPDHDEDELWRLTGQSFVTITQSEDFAEGPRAFIEKRAPVWKGR